jgi:hypothetical protein
MNKQDRQKKNMVMRFIQKVKSKPSTYQDTLKVDEIGEQEAQQIKEATGKDTQGYDRVIQADKIRHILKRHGNDSNGQNGNDQTDATPSLIAHAIAKLSKPNEVTLNQGEKQTGDITSKVDCKQVVGHVSQQLSEEKQEVRPVTAFFKIKKAT